MKVIGYCRVSTREQADDGYGLAAQRTAITAEAERRGWDLEIIEDAGVSARNLNRPGIRRALAMLKRREADTLVVTKLDRVARSTVDFGGLLALATRQRWRLVVLDIGVDMTTPNGRLVARILAAVAEWESEMIGCRTADAMAEAKAGGARFGAERRASPAATARVMQLREHGWSFGRIAATLDAERIQTPGGGARWYGSTVARLHRAVTAEQVAS